MNGRQRAVWGTLVRAMGIPETARGRKGRPAQGGSTTGQRRGRHSSICVECSRTPEPWAGREWGEATGVSREGGTGPACVHTSLPEGQEPTAAGAALSGVPSTQAMLPVSSFITALKEGTQTPRRCSPQPGRAVGGYRSSRGLRQRARGHCGSMVKSSPRGSQRLHGPRRNKLFWTESSRLPGRH